MFGSIWLNLVIGLAMNGATSGLCQAMYHRYQTMQQEQAAIANRTTEIQRTLTTDLAESDAGAGKDGSTDSQQELSKATKEVEDRLVITMSFLCITLSFGSAPSHMFCSVNYVVAGAWCRHSSWLFRC